MRIQSYNSQAGPKNMIPDVFNSAPNFTLGAGKLLGFEVPFYVNGSILNSTARGNKGITLFSNSDTSSLLRANTMYADESESHFGSDSSAYDYGVNRAAAFKYVFGDYEGLYGNVNDPTTRNRVANFGKGMMDGGSYYGQWVDGMEYFTGIQVWDTNAIAFYNTPAVSGIGNQGVSIGGKLHDYLNLNIVIGYGVDVSRDYKRLDPEAALYNYIHRFRALNRLKQANLVTHVQKQIGFLAGYCDNFGNNIPTFHQRTFLDSPYNPGSYVWIDYLSEESLAQMESYAIWGILEGDGIWYWKAPGIALSDKRNDSVDILYSGFPLSLCGFSGSPSPPTPFGFESGNRPVPNRYYSVVDGLSVEEQFKGAHKISQITEVLNGGTQTDSPYSYKRPVGSWTTVTKPVNGYGIVEDYSNKRPIVKKVVKGNIATFIVTDPGAANYSQTKIKLAHGGKQWLVAMQDQRTEIFSFTF